MRTEVMTLVAVILATSTFPCEAQSILSSSVVPLVEPVEMAYRDIDKVGISGSLSVTTFKEGHETHAQSHTFEGTTSASIVGDMILLSIYAGVDSGQPEEMSCQMRPTGEILECSDISEMTLPLYDRETYKSGDTVTLPFVRIDGARRVLDGKIRGTAFIAQRRVLVIDFADRRAEKINVKGATIPMDLIWKMVGYAYLDIATGYPVEMEVSADMIGPPTPDVDLAHVSMKLKYAFPGTAN